MRSSPHVTGYHYLLAAAKQRKYMRIVETHALRGSRALPRFLTKFMEIR